MPREDATLILASGALGLLGGAILVAVLGPVIAPLTRTPLVGVPPWVAGWLSSAALVAVANLAWWRRRQPQERLDPSAYLGALLGLTALALVLGCGLGVTRPWLATLLCLSPCLLLSLGWVVGGPAARRRPRAAASVAWLVLIVSLPLTMWPARLTTAVSRGALDALAAQVRAGSPVTGPTRAGLLLIQGSQLRGGVAFLITDPNPAGPGGLARCDPSAVSGRFNPWFAFPAHPDWLLVFED